MGGENIESSAKIFMQVLKGEGSQAQTNVVCANAGMAIATAEQLDPITGFERS